MNSTEKPKNSPDPKQIFSAPAQRAGDDPTTPDVEEIVAPLTAEEIARATDALNFTLVAFGVPDKFRAFIDSLIGRSGGSMDWFEAADIEIAQRGREVTSQALKEKSLARWTQRFREEFAEWERAHALTLIEFMPGGQTEGQNYKSRYRVAALLTSAVETDRRAREKSIQFERNPKRELRKAAAAVYSEFRAAAQQPVKRGRFRHSHPTCDSYLKLISTYLEKLCGRALIERRNLSADLETISLIIKKKHELLNNSTAHFSNSTQTQQTQEDRESGRGDNLSPRNLAQNTDSEHTNNINQRTYARREGRVRI